MARYTPEFLASLRQRYEQTDQPMRALAREFEIGISTLSSLVEKQGWAKRSQRPRERPATMGLLAEAQTLIATLPPRESQCAQPQVTPTPTLPVSRGGSQPASAAELEAEATLSPAARLEALIVKEIAAEEAARDDLGALPRLRSEADGCVRRLAILGQTLQTVQKLRAEERAQAQQGKWVYDDEMPEDIDAFRIDLAHRIRTFVASRRENREITQSTDATSSPLPQVGSSSE